MNDLRRIAESSREAVKLIETLPTVCANRAFFPLPRLATCSCKTFRGRSNRMLQSLAFACLSYGGNDRKRGNNLLLKYENETPKAFFLISIKCYPLCATLPLAHGARIFASLSENPQNSAVEPTSVLGIPACRAKLPNGFCSAFQYVNVLLAAACLNVRNACRLCGGSSLQEPCARQR